MEPEQPQLRRWRFAGPVEQAYELARAPVAVIIGPTGGGKSTGSARRCLRVATWQHPSPRDGVRRARIVCICPTYRRAWDTVMPSYFKVFPQHDGKFRGARGDPADHIFDWEVVIGGKRAPIHVEVLFRAVNDLDIEEFFRGLEATAFWLPEMDTNDSEAILSFASNRVGRYPEPDDRPYGEGVEPAYAGVFGDANAPLIDGWFHRRFYTAPKPTDAVFVQPSGFSANAENMENLRKIRPDYYPHMASQLEPHEVRRLLENRPGYGRAGQPVHPNFDQDVHVARRTLEVDPLVDVVIGVDAGSNALVPGVTFSQRGYSGQWRTLAEIHLAEGQMGTPELGQTIRQVMDTRFAKARGAFIAIDPAAASGNAMSEFSTAQALQHFTNIEVQLAPSQDPKQRRSALNSLLIRNVAPKEPAFVVDPACVGLINGLAGGFHYPKRGSDFAPAPAKNRFSHVCEAQEYAVLAGEGVGAFHGRLIGQGVGGEDTPTKVIN